MAKKTQKTHKGLAKVTKVRKRKGKITGVEFTGHTGSLHNTGKKTTKFSRSRRKKSNMTKADFKRVKGIL